MKLQSVAQQKQLQYMRPYLCKWAGDEEHTISGMTETKTHQRLDAGRRRAAPHIKTYIRFSDKTAMNEIDWALITSANISTQAWGAAPNSNGEVRICSWEVGVLVWPELIVGNPLESDLGRSKMVPCFKKDVPDPAQYAGESPIVGLRMPYDIPLTPYAINDTPWSATINHHEPDWLGNKWEIQASD